MNEKNKKYAVNALKKARDMDQSLNLNMNIEDIKEKRKAIPIMVRHGTKNVPLIVFEDENLQEVSAIWSEQNPDWKSEILKNLK